MIHLYAFVHGLRSIPDRAGVDGEQPEPYPFGSVIAVVGTVRAAPDDAAAAALAHGLVVESLLDCADGVLPVRFGRPFASHAALAEVTVPRLAELRRQLLRVRGCVEVSVRIAAEREARPETRDGTHYLNALAESAARRDACAAEVDGVLQTVSLDSRVDRRGDGEMLFDGAYLVRRGELSAFARRVDALADQLSDLTVLCTGPWAPYSFVGDPA